MIIRIFLLALTVSLGACASRSPAESGTYLVYRNAAGAPTMQFDYPTEDFCKQVEAIAPARCERSSVASLLLARATLRNEPPGMDVTGHYPDLKACQLANSRMAMGVKLVAACANK